MAKKSSVNKNERRRKMAKQFAGKRAALKKTAGDQTLSISLGTSGDYLIGSIAADNNHLKKFGKGSPLSAHTSLAPVREHLTKPNLLGLHYVSQELAMLGYQTPEQLVRDLLTVAGRTVLDKPLDDGHQFRIYFEPTSRTVTEERVVRYRTVEEPATVVVPAPR